jgi:hypothetical protein
VLCWKSASLAGKRIRFGTNRVTISEPIRVEPLEGDTVALCSILNTYTEIRPKLFSYLP